jgi:hypothetical protein
VDQVGEKRDGAGQDEDRDLDDRRDEERGE